jgi:hypothetical protein
MSYQRSISGNAIVDKLISVEGWGRALYSPRLPTRCFAWMGIVATVSIILFFYYALNKGASWANFLIFLIVDAGVNVFALGVILSTPVSVASGFMFELSRSNQLGVVPLYDRVE